MKVEDISNIYFQREKEVKEEDAKNILEIKNGEKELNQVQKVENNSPITETKPQDDQSILINASKNGLKFSIPIEWILVQLFSIKNQLGFGANSEKSGFLSIDFFRDKRLFEKFFSQNSWYKFEYDDSPKEEPDKEKEEKTDTNNEFSLENDINHQNKNKFSLFTEEAEMMIKKFYKFIKCGNFGTSGNCELKIEDPEFKVLDTLLKLKERGCFDEELVQGLMRLDQLSKNIQNKNFEEKRSFIRKRGNRNHRGRWNKRTKRY